MARIKRLSWKLCAVVRNAAGPLGVKRGWVRMEKRLSLSPHCIYVDTPSRRENTPEPFFWTQSTTCVTWHRVRTVPNIGFSAIALACRELLAV
jgi:hypothetical protein